MGAQLFASSSRLSNSRFGGCPAFPFKGLRSSQRLFTAMGICGIDLEDWQFRVVVYLVDVPIVGSAFQLFAAFLMGVQLFVHRFDGCPAFRDCRFDGCAAFQLFPCFLMGVQLFARDSCFSATLMGVQIFRCPDFHQIFITFELTGILRRGAIGRE